CEPANSPTTKGHYQCGGEERICGVGSTAIFSCDSSIRVSVHTAGWSSFGASSASDAASGTRGFLPRRYFAAPAMILVVLALLISGGRRPRHLLYFDGDPRGSGGPQARYWWASRSCCCRPLSGNSPV